MALLFGNNTPGHQVLPKQTHCVTTTSRRYKSSSKKHSNPTCSNRSTRKEFEFVSTMGMARKPSRTARMSSGNTNNSNGDGQNLSSLTWVMITDPSQSRDRDTMRNVRVHVMNDYLSKEQRNPHSTDIRVRNSVRRSCRPSSSSPEARKKLGTSETRSRSPCARDSVIEYVPPPPSESMHREMEEESFEDAEAAALAPYVASKAQLGGIGAKCDVFNATPRFDGEHIDVKMLKHSCTTYFGSQAMCKRWAPMLFAGRSAFLSTLCISSAYLDMMQMDFARAKTSNSVESVRTLTVREQTVKLISESLSDPQTCCSDGNIVAVLHLLYGEMMVAGDQALKWHEEGLNTMVNYRGGLNSLGSDGLLASMLTIEVFELAIFREACPRQEYVDYARYVSGPARQERVSAIPESPLYYPTGVHHTLGRSGRCDEDTLQLINLIRDLTQAVLDLNCATMAENSAGRAVGPAQARKIFTEQETQALQKRKDETITRIVGLRSRSDPVYEATRLCALLYATAIHCNMPLSTTALSFPTQSGSSSIITLIRDHLAHSDLSNCWDSMVGILFWITLVMGAACNDVGNDAEVLATRKWMIALAIRCSILLSFQHTDAVVRMLRTLLAVQNVLSGAPVDWEG